MDERKYCKEGDGKHVTSTETTDPPVPNRARTEMKREDVEVGDPIEKSHPYRTPTIEG